MARRLLIPALLAALPMAMLYPLWSCPTSAGEDDMVYYWPLRQTVARHVRAGRWPGSSGEACGVPLLADPQSGVLFPPNWLCFVLPLKLGYSLCVFLAFAAAGTGAYVYLRRMSLTASAAIFGAVAFQFSGFMVGHRVHLAMIQTASLLPWGLWAIEQARRGGFRSGILRMAPIAALALAAGHWPTVMHLVAVWLAYLLIRGRPLLRSLAAAGAACAIGTAVVAPQIIATAAWLGGSIRADVPLDVAGENSFFPLCGILAAFPFLMGSRTPNFFGQAWWGPWHLCEMLGYVGLATLVLGAAGVWRLYRRRGAPEVSGDPPGADVTGMVRAWTWILIGAGVWAMGYYLPTFRLIHAIPLMGKVRCPARMLLAVDMALAALAAAAIHALATAPPGQLSRTVRRAACVGLPVGMLAALGLVELASFAEGRWWSIEMFLSGSGAMGLSEAVQWRAPSTAIIIPALLAAATIAAVLWVLRRPGRRAPLLTAVLVADLFVIARFVDVPGAGRPCPDPQRSPAAAFLKRHAAPGPYRVWGLSSNYHRRAAELLLPKTCAGLGFETIAYYGPLGPAAHARLFGFRPWGANPQWRWLVRRNHLLSLFNVRYLLAADAEVRGVIESVRIPAGPPAPDGPNLLGESWALTNARRRGDVLILDAGLWSFAQAEQPVALAGAGIYRIALDARAPAGAGNCVRAAYLPDGGPDMFDGTPGTVRLDVEQLTPRWRHFEGTFLSRGVETAAAVFRLHTYGEQPIEVRNVRLFASDWPEPINFGGRLAAGERVYVDLTPDGLEADPTGIDPPVHVYENLLCLPRAFEVESATGLDDEEAVIETLRWRPEAVDLTREALVAGGAAGAGGTFVSENPAAGAPGTPANALGAIRRPGDAGARRAGLGAAGLVLSALGLGAYAAVAAIRRKRMNRKPATDVAGK